MIISTQTDIIAARLGEEKGVDLLCRVGYDALDYSMFEMHNDDCVLNTPKYEAHALELKKIAEANGKYFNQAHAPFATLRDGDEEYNQKTFPRVKRAIEVAGIMGINAIVVHPVAFKENQFEKNIEMYNELLPVAKEFGTKIALENMWGRDKESGKIVPNVCSTGEDFPVYVDALDPEYFTACLDLGHCGLVGDNAPDMIRALGGERLTCLHVHDNDGKNDTHYPPFTFSMDWQAIADALREINYSGDLTLEADAILKKLPENCLEDCARFMLKTAKTLAEMVER